MHRKAQIPMNELSREDNCLAESGSESGSFLGRCELLVVRHWGEWRCSCCNHKRLPWRETERDWKRMGFRGFGFGGDWDSVQQSQAIYSHASLSLPGKPNDPGFFPFFFHLFIIFFRVNITLPLKLLNIFTLPQSNYKIIALFPKVDNFFSCIWKKWDV